MSEPGYREVLVEEGGTNHVLHLLLTIFTCGLWLPVWLIAAIFASKKKLVKRVEKETWWRK